MPETQRGEVPQRSAESPLEPAENCPEHTGEETTRGGARIALKG